MDNKLITIKVEEFKEVLEDLNKIICSCKDEYLWKEISGIDAIIRNWEITFENACQKCLENDKNPWNRPCKLCKYFFSNNGFGLNYFKQS